MKKNKNPRLFFNSAGASLMPARSVETIKAHLDLEGCVGGYEAQRICQDRLEAVYHSLARFLNCQPDEVALMENATAAWHVALQAINLSPGDEIITPESEYVSNYMMFLHLQKQMDLTLHVIGNDGDGVMDLARLQDCINEKTRLISIPHVPTNSGRINPVEKIGQIPRPKRCFYLVDACQSVGQMPVDVNAINCDFLTATSRKFIRGPRGVGFLYVRGSRLKEIDPALIDLRGATLKSSEHLLLDPSARRFENKERSIANVLGFGVSLEVALEKGLDQIFKINQVLADYLRTELAKIPNLALHVDCPDQCAIVTFSIKGSASAKIVQTLRDAHIYTSLIDPAGAILESERKGLDELVRVSVHYENTLEEIDLLIEKLKEILP